MKINFTLKKIVNDAINLSWVNVSALVFIFFVILQKLNLGLVMRPELDKSLFLMGLLGSLEYYWFRASSKFVCLCANTNILRIDINSILLNSALLSLSIFLIIYTLGVPLDSKNILLCIIFNLTSLILVIVRLCYEKCIGIDGALNIKHRIERLVSLSLRVFIFFCIIFWNMDGLLLFLFINIIICFFVISFYRRCLTHFKVKLIYINILNFHKFDKIKPSFLFFLNGFLGVFDRGLILGSNNEFASAFFAASLFSRKSTIIMESNVAAVQSYTLKNFSFSKRTFIQSALLIISLMSVALLIVPINQILVTSLIFLILTFIYVITFFITGPKIEYLIAENSSFPIILAFMQFFILFLCLFFFKDSNVVQIPFLLGLVLIKSVLQILITSKAYK